MYTLNSGLYTSTASLNLFVMYSIYTSKHINRYSFEIFFLDNQEGRNINRKNQCGSGNLGPTQSALNDLGCWPNRSSVLRPKNVTGHLRSDNNNHGGGVKPPITQLTARKQHAIPQLISWRVVTASMTAVATQRSSFLSLPGQPV